MGFFSTALKIADAAADKMSEPKVIKSASADGWNTPSMTDFCIGCGKKARQVTDGVRHCHRTSCMRAAAREAADREKKFGKKAKGKKAKKKAGAK